jgi:hypothetical protein
MRGVELEILCLAELPPRLVQQPGPGGSQRDPAGVLTHDKLHRQDPFEFRQGRRHGRLRQMAPRCGSSHATCLCDRDQVFELSQRISRPAGILGSNDAVAVTSRVLPEAWLNRRGSPQS